jgi:hypothetical protein
MHSAMHLRSPRVLGLAAATLVVAGWLLGSTLSPPVAQTQTRSAARATPSLALPEIVPFTGLAVRATLAPPVPARNPFAFGRGAGAAESTAAAGAAPAPGVSAAEPELAPATASAAVDEWRLIGVAVGADGAVTAIVRGQGDVHLARAGDHLTSDVVVREVGEGGVRLQRSDGSTIDLRLP